MYPAPPTTKIYGSSFIGGGSPVRILAGYAISSEEMQACFLQELDKVERIMIRKFGWKALWIAGKCVSRPLHLSEMAEDPFVQFDQWFATAKQAQLPEPTAMSVASVGPDGMPSQRMVLMKHISAQSGVTFYTNYGSRKAQELIGHPKASLLFHYHILQRQIRFSGRVEKTSREESEAYFASRPRDSQLGAWASIQSEVLADRETFEARFEDISKRFSGQTVPCPEFWGGFRVIPERIEFWQGRAFRLHDRFVYTPEIEGGWTRKRLYP